MLSGIFTFILYLASQTILRSFLVFYAIQQDQIAIFSVFSIIFIGLLNDLIICFFVYPFISLAKYIYSLAARFFHHICFFFQLFLNTIFIFFILSSALAEFFFWEEFGTRFNFIAVDYLIYTHEIIGTIKDTIDLNKTLIILFFLSVIICFLSIRLEKRFCQKLNLSNYNISNFKKILILLASFAVTVCLFLFYDSEKFNKTDNAYALELKKNGHYEFILAFFRNDLSYSKFYPSIERDEALRLLRQDFQENDFIDNDITRNVKNNLSGNDFLLNQEIALNKFKPNVILIVVESLNASFMEFFGSARKITPNLDFLASQSIFFTKFYATGTRTVRGLEGITLSVPPTPGSSIIRRPKNKNLFNIASVFKNEGYDNFFLFGGYSYFDNLENYFSNNNFQVIDRTDFDASEISFANIWGVADENLFDKSLKLADKLTSKTAADNNQQRPFFFLIMTTSNHRPFTFPEGRIDLPSGQGRSAAVKYSDFAVGRFIEEAKKRSWFDNTIFIITADHCATGTGKITLPFYRYHIPLMIYAPKLLKPAKIDILSSQIDVAPTLFALLNFEYKSKFFGYNILSDDFLSGKRQGRALISTYQLLGYLKGEYLTILSPQKDPEIFKVDFVNETQSKISEVKNHLINQAISYYQLAYEFFIKGKMKDFTNAQYLK